MPDWSRQKGIFLQIFCPYKSAKLDLYVLFKSSDFAQIIKQQKKLSSNFFCEEDKFL